MSATNDQPPASPQSSSPDVHSGNLPPEIVQSIAIASANSVGIQPAILANIALANQITNLNLAQQNAIANQQAMNQVMLATMAKCVEIIFAIDPKDAQGVDHLKATIKEIFELMNSQASENLKAQQEMMSQCLAAVKQANEQADKDES